MKKQFFIYIMANERPTLYTGMTNNLVKRAYKHKNEVTEGFTKKYHIHKLVYFEASESALGAIVREKQIKDMNRADKIKLIETKNPTLKDLYKEIIGEKE